jgi:hypothetical protein
MRDIRTIKATKVTAETMMKTVSKGVFIFSIFIIIVLINKNILPNLEKTRIYFTKGIRIS